MTHTAHVRAFDRWIEIAHPGREDDFKVIDEVLVGNVYRLEPAQVKDKVVVDCGAHIGTFSALAVACHAANVLSIEPHDTNYDFLQRNISRAIDMHGKCEWSCYQAAIGRAGQRVTLRGDGATGQTTTPVLDDQTVPALSLSHLLNEAGGRIDFLKVDVEGAEYEWFADADPNDLALVDKIRMEWHGRALASRMSDTPPIGELVTKLLDTHSVSLFGRPRDGGVLLAHAYEWDA
jgi:FkbM family methyltransferase